MRKVVPTNTRLLPADAKLVFQGVIFDVYHWQQQLYDGTFATFESLKRPDTVTVFAIVDGKLLITVDEQPHRDAVITPPGGRVDPGDRSTLAAAKRELKEETGYSFDDWRLVDVVRPQEKIEFFIYTYLAQGTYTQAPPKHDAGERITFKLMAFEEIKKLVADNAAPRLAEQRLLRSVSSLEELCSLPEFEGEEVEIKSKDESS